MIPRESFELPAFMPSEENIDPLQIVERIPIVVSTGAGVTMQIVEVRRMVHDNTTTAHVIRESFHIGGWKRFWMKMMLRKLGIFVGTVEMREPATVKDAIDHPVQSQIRTVETSPCKDLEKALSKPAIGANWSPYTVILSNEDAIPVPLKALIIKWRPTKDKTKQALRTTGNWLLRIGCVVAAGEAHDAIDLHSALDAHKVPEISEEV